MPSFPCWEEAAGNFSIHRSQITVRIIALDFGCMLHYYKFQWRRLRWWYWMMSYLHHTLLFCIPSTTHEVFQSLMTRRHYQYPCSSKLHKIAMSETTIWYDPKIWWPPIFWGEQLYSVILTTLLVLVPSNVTDGNMWLCDETSLEWPNNVSPRWRCDNRGKQQMGEIVGPKLSNAYTIFVCVMDRAKDDEHCCVPRWCVPRIS